MIAEVMRRSSRLASARAASSLGSGAVEKRKTCKTASRQRRKLSSGNERTVAKKIKTRAGAEAALDKRSRYVQMASDAVAGRRDAEAQVVLARGSEQSIRLISEAVGEREIPLLYLLGEQYIKAMTDMSKSPNAKTVVLPADILNTVRGMMGEVGDKIHRP